MSKRPSAEAYFVMVYAHPRLGKTRRTVFYRRLGPMPYHLAQLSAKKWGARSFTCKVQLDRTQYWAEYHRDRYDNDPKYVERKRDHAREWQRARSKETQP